MRRCAIIRLIDNIVTNIDVYTPGTWTPPEGFRAIDIEDAPADAVKIGDPAPEGAYPIRQSAPDEPVSAADRQGLPQDPPQDPPPPAA